MDDAPFRQAFAAFGKSGSVGSVEAETGGEQTSLLGSLRERVSGWGPSAAPREAELLGLTWTQRLAGGVLCAGLAAMCFVLAFMSLITAVVNPARVATPYSLGSLFLIASMALFRGPRLFIRSALARDRLLFTLAYLLSIVVTLILAFVRAHLLPNNT